MSRKWKVGIVNIVATSRIGENLDLKRIARLNGAKYDPKVFPGVILKVEQPKAAILVFKSGRTVCTGTKRIEDAEAALKKVVEDISRLGIEVKLGQVKIQNIVASADLGFDVNLNALALGLLEDTEYEPEQFPGLFYKLDEPRALVLVFSSGKIVIVGCKDEECIERAVKKVYDTFSSMGFV